ncbi:MAG: rod shape-determining protein MreC [Proteobacteria bacterium]|nr:rod shape-determining protein MreC [Pseudomonadota bacterium]
MPLGTLDRTAPPLFNQGPSALSKLILFSALAIFLMVADARFHLVQPIRSVIGTVLYPVQWLALKPVQMVLGGTKYFDDLQTAQYNEDQARKALASQAERASQADAMAQDNARLRSLLELRQTTITPGRAAEVLYDAADPYSRKIIIDQGQTQGIVPGSPVIDADGVLGQVTLVNAFTSEVTLVIDRDLSIPVQNTRTGARSVAFGDATAHGAGMELRFMGANADLREGDLLATSGVDGVYPAGVPVARIERIERRADSAFARIYCMPLATVSGARYVLVLAPVGQQGLRPAPAATDPLAVTKKKEKEKADKAKADGKAKGKADKADKADKPADPAADKPVDKAPEAAAQKPTTQKPAAKPPAKPAAAAAPKTTEGRAP